MKKKKQFWGHWLYKLLFAYVIIIHRLYYRRLTVVGLEKIPSDKPVIFAPNHQNALMDALAVLFTAGKPIGFLARSDIFQKPIVAKILNLLKILPIYRIRDGYDSLGRNQEVFENTIEVLKSNMPICILPEGNHDGHKRLRPLKKGIFRIAFQAEKSASFAMDLHIVPVGIDYSDYFNAGADLLVIYGTPIKVSEYAAQYHENEQRTVNLLMNVLAEGMRNVMINIPEENYNLISQISEMYEPNVWNTCNIKRHPYNRITIKQYIVQKATEEFSRNPGKADELNKALREYNSKLSKLNIPDCLLQQKSPRFFALLLETIFSIVLLPAHIYSLIVNYLPYKIAIGLASKIKDKHFKSSVQFVITMFLLPVYYILIFALFCLFTDGLLLRLIFAITLPIAGLFALYNYKHMLKLIEKIRFFIFRQTKSEQYNSLHQERVQLIELIKSTINS